MVLRIPTALLLNIKQQTGQLEKIWKKLQNNDRVNKKD
jgi:hypothetical protein